MLTTVPGVIDALLAALRASPALDGVLILDGQPLQTLDYGPAILVGFRGVTGAPSVRADRAEADLGGATDRETYTLWSMLSVSSGDTDFAPLRTRVVGLLQAVTAVVRADPTLGGTVARARVASTEMDQVQTQGGAEVNVEVGLAVDAWVRR